MHGREPTNMFLGGLALIAALEAFGLVAWWAVVVFVFVYFVSTSFIGLASRIQVQSIVVCVRVEHSGALIDRNTLRPISARRRAEPDILWEVV
jgi:hypothetical protein